MEKSESIKNIATALIKFQSSVGTIPKDSKNPFFKSSYAALPDILGTINTHLIDAGLTINQFPTGVNGLTTIVIHADSGEYMMDTYYMTPTKNDPQGQGSCITYQRRYAIGAVLSLNIDEDDDGNKASVKVEPKQQSKPIAVTEKELPWLNTQMPEWHKAVEYLADGIADIPKLKKQFRIREESVTALNEAVKVLQAERLKQTA